MTLHSIEQCLRLDHRAAAGHFPGNPIIPGAVLLREVVRIVAGDGPGVCEAIRSAKFLHPVRPGDCLVVGWEERAGGEIRFSCRTAPAGPAVLTGVLRLRPR